MNILVVAAHPDDETCGMGGTIAKLNKLGNQIYVCILSDGVGARHGEHDKQRQCAQDACEILGVKKVFFHDIPDQKFDRIGLLEIARIIEENIRETQATVVFCPAFEDVNQDHRAAFQATMIATRPLPNSPIKHILSYEIPSSSEWLPPSVDIFKPNVYVDIENFMCLKLDAMKQYGKTHISELKEFPHPRSIEGLKSYDRYRGVSSGISSAESFHLIRSMDWLSQSLEV